MSETGTVQLENIEGIFKSLVWDNLVTAGISALMAYAPWLNAWPIGSAVRYLLTLFTDRMFQAVKLSIDLQAIVFVNQGLKVAYNTELLKLKILAHDKGIGSPEFLKERENAKKALAKFVGYNAVP